MNTLLISDPECRPEEHVTLEQLFARGLQRFHLRKPKASYHDLKKWLSTLSAGWLPRVVLHSHYELAQDFDCCGVHLRDTAERHELLAGLRIKLPEVSISTSVHALTDLSYWAKHCDYLLLSPVFDCISKPKRRAAFTDNDISSSLSSISKPVFALGGCSADKVNRARELGFDGIALLGAVWHSPSPVTSFDNILSVLGTAQTA